MTLRLLGTFQIFKIWKPFKFFQGVYRMKSKNFPITATIEICEKYQPTVLHDSPHEKILKNFEEVKFKGINHIIIIPKLSFI